MVKRVGYIVSNFPCYSETFILREMWELKRRGYDIFVFSLKRTSEVIFQPQYLEFRDRIFYFSFKGVFFSRKCWHFVLKNLFKILKIFIFVATHTIDKPLVFLKNMYVLLESIYFSLIARDVKIHLLHSHFANYPASCAYFISYFLQIPFSFTMHAHDIFKDTHLLDKKIESAKKVISISDFNKNYVLKLFPYIDESKIEVIHCGIDVHKFCPQNRLFRENKLKIISVGRLVPTKGFDTLVRFCFFLKNKGVDFRCLIIGGGPLEERLKKLIFNLGLREYVNLTAPQAENKLLRYYQESDFFILPAKKVLSWPDVQDGIPVTLMEAMSMELVVVSSPISGIPELIEDGKNGFLIPPPHYKHRLWNIIKIFIEEPQRFNSIRKNARKKILEEFNLKHTVSRFEEVVLKDA